MGTQITQARLEAAACALAIIYALPIGTAHAAPVSLSSPYSQSFDSLAATGTNVPWSDDVTIAGWYSSRTTYTANNGASNTGSLYSYGTTSASERALGSLASGSTGTLTYGVRLANDTANTITSVAVQYNGEQWREGGGTTASLQQKLDFAYKVTGSDLTGGAFVDVDPLDFNGPHFGVTAAAALDGNASGNHTLVSGTISGLALAPGQVIWLQWSDINDTGNDHGFAVDDLSVVVTATSTGGGGGGGDPCTESDTPIGTVQGTGSAAAITTPVTVQGIVVGDYEGPSPALRGFYLQDQSDSDPATSNAIFIFNGDADSVSLGDEVQVTGTPAEFQDQTQLSSLTGIEVCGHGKTLAPTPVVLPAANAAFLERYEGMLVSFSQPLFVTEMFQLGRFGQFSVAGGARLAQPTNVVEPGAAANALQAQNDLDTVIVDDASQAQDPDPIIFGRGGQPLSASNTLRGGDSVSGLQGVMTYTWSGNAASGNAWRVRPVNALGTTLPNIVASNPRPAAAPSVSGNLKIASANLLNYFNTFGTTSCTFGVGGAVAECRGADNATEYGRQAAKTVAAISAINADILAFMEMENDGYGASSAVQDLVNRVNAVMGANTYAFVDFDARTGITNAGGTDAIKVGMLYKPAVVTLVANGTFADQNPIHNRAPLAQTFQQTATGARITVIGNHFKSKSCGDGNSTGSDADLGDGQGCFNGRRTSQANALVSFINTVRNATNEPDVLVVGDLNSYAKEDPIDVLVASGLTNLIAQYDGDSAYSYVFDGQWGYLDQALATASLVQQVTGAADFHINADEPSELDYNTDFKSTSQIASLYAPDFYRVSDHDPLLVGVQLKPAAPVPALGAWGAGLLTLLLGCGLLVVIKPRRA